MVLVGECRGWDEETDLVEHWQAYRHLFPAIPERSRFNRRRRALAPAINDLRRRFLCGDGAEVTMGLGIIGLIGAIVVAVIILRLAGIL